MCEEELESEVTARRLKAREQDAKFERRYQGDNMFKCQRFWLSLYDGYSHKRAILVLLGVTIYVTLVLPYKLYSLNVIDRHYFGYFDDLEP
jgi:hypothetical protein